MRVFTISKNFQQYEYDLLEERIDNKLPKELFQILEIYSGMGIEENLYLDKNNKSWTLTSFLRFHEIYSYFENIEEELSFAKLDIKLLSFAGENGGWRFCVSTEENYPVYVFKSTDYAGKDAFEKISSSFNEFINELQLPNRKKN